MGKKIKRRKSKARVSRPFAVTKVPKKNKRGVKPGVALVFGSKTNSRLGLKRFRTVKNAKAYASKKWGG